MGLVIMMGLGYTYLHRGHIAVDILVSRLSERRRAILDLVLFPLFFIGVSALVWRIGIAAGDSLRVTEDYTSALGPPIYPYKIMMFVGVSLLLLQGIAKFLRDLRTAFTGAGA